MSCACGRRAMARWTVCSGIMVAMKCPSGHKIVVWPCTCMLRNGMPVAVGGSGGESVAALAGAAANASWVCVACVGVLLNSPRLPRQSLALDSGVRCAVGRTLVIGTSVCVSLLWGPLQDVCVFQGGRAPCWFRAMCALRADTGAGMWQVLKCGRCCAAEQPLGCCVLWLVAWVCSACCHVELLSDPAHWHLSLP
jgi:hypothetical protein